MHKEQLVKAFQLMKDGEKGQATVIVKGILREDPKNINAWWLMSHIFDDEDKIVKSLEKVLSIDPNHQAARTRLAKLRPEYGNLVSDDVNVAKQIKKDGAKAEQNYWKKLDSPPQRSKSGMAGSLFAGLFFRFGWRLVVAIIILSVGSIGAYYNSIQSEKTLPDINGSTPQEAVETFFYADAVQDADTLYAITCPDLHYRVDVIVADFENYRAADTVDFSTTVFELEHHDFRNDRAYVIMSGITTYTGSGYTTTYDWREAAQSEGYDFYAEFAHKIDGQWVVCTEYNVPDINHDNREE